MIQELAERWPEIAVAVAAVAVLAVVGGAATDVGPWYKGLKFPRLKPPDWAFGPGWTVIYLFIAASAVVGWDARQTPRTGRLMMLLFAINGVLNVLWSPLFFKLQAARPGALRMGSLLAVDRRAGRLHVPHLDARRLADRALSRLGHLRRLAQLARRRAEPAFRRAIVGRRVAARVAAMAGRREVGLFDRRGRRAGGARNGASGRGARSGSAGARRGPPRSPTAWRRIALLVALRAAVGDAPFLVIWTCIAAALIAHVADLAMRWRVSPLAPTSFKPFHLPRRWLRRVSRV